MNPYYVPPYMQQPQAQPVQPLPPHVDPRVVSFFVAKNLRECYNKDTRYEG